MNNQIAIVAKAAENTQTARFGKRSVLQLSINNEIEKVWSDADDAALFSLSVGDTVEVQRIGRSFKLIKKVATITATTKPRQTEKQVTAERELYKTLDNQMKKKIVDEIKLQSKLYKTCLNQVCEDLEEFSFKDEDLRAIATTIYIKVTKPI